jgi:hypothetical protein
MIWAQTANFVLGLLASLVGWLAIALLLTPRLKVSRLNRIQQDRIRHPSGYRYRVKLINRSRYFAVGDLNLHARLVIPGLDKARPDARTSIYLPVGTDTPFPVLSRRSKREPDGEWERVYTINYLDMVGNGVSRLSPEIQDQLESRTITLHELLQIYPGSFIRFAVAGTHGRSGVRRTYITKFDIFTITEGEFQSGSIGLKSGPTTEASK